MKHSRGLGIYKKSKLGLCNPQISIWMFVYELENKPIGWVIAKKNKNKKSKRKGGGRGGIIKTQDILNYFISENFSFPKQIVQMINMAIYRL